MGDWTTRARQEDLHPALRVVMREVLAYLRGHGRPFKAYSGLRTFDEQNELYAKGRTKPGGIVTKARGGQSMHNYGLAVDSAPYNLMTPEEWDVHWPDPDKKDSVWFLLEEALTEVGQLSGDPDTHLVEFEWGGRWRFRDVPHIQIRTTLAELRNGLYPATPDTEWLVNAHTTFLFQNSDWIMRRAQYLLNELEHNAGPVDGLMGPRTRDALIDFQGINGLAKSGGVDIPTVGELVRAHQRVMFP